MFWCFNLHNDQWYSPDKNHFIEILNLCIKTEVCKMDNIFVLKNQPKSVLKDVAVYALTFRCSCCRFEMVCMMIFKIRG